MTRDEPLDPIATQLKRAAEHKRQSEVASQGKQLFDEDFAGQARVAAPGELVRIETILRERGTAINASNVPGLPRLEFVKSPTTRVANSRLDAGKFAIEIQPYEQLRQFTVTVIVGLRPNAAQFLASIPRIPSKTSTYRAAADDDGFFWTDTKRGGRSFVGAVTNALSLTRFGGHLPKGGYDVQNGIKESGTATTAAVHG